MTTAIEQAKREMYRAWQSIPRSFIAGPHPFKDFESKMESYLEQLRQQYEEMASTARQRFESIQSLEAANHEMQSTNDHKEEEIRSKSSKVSELTMKLREMTESRDMFRNLHQAATHAAIESHAEPATPHQDSGERASCEQPDAKTMAILGAVADVQRIVSDWALGDTKAKHAMREIAAIVNGDLDVAKALDAFENPRKYYEIVCHAQFDDCVKTTRSLHKTECMHSFFAIGDDQFKCTFCGVGK